MDKAEKIDKVGKLFEEFHHLHEEYARLRLDQTFLHWDWWCSVILAAGSWILPNTRVSSTDFNYFIAFGSGYL